MYEGWKPREAFVILEVQGPDDLSKYRVEGDPELVETIKEVLRFSCGFRGHGLREETTAVDLGCAMNDVTMRPYQPELIEGGELFAVDPSDE